jgi:hypothetical protein
MDLAGPPKLPPGQAQGSADKFVHNEGFAARERFFIVDAPLASVNAAGRNM